MQPKNTSEINLFHPVMENKSVRDQAELGEGFCYIAKAAGLIRIIFGRHFYLLTPNLT